MGSSKSSYILMSAQNISYIKMSKGTSIYEYDPQSSVWSFGPWNEWVHTERVVEKNEGHCGGGGQDETSGSF